MTETPTQAAAGTPTQAAAGTPAQAAAGNVVSSATKIAEFLRQSARGERARIMGILNVTPDSFSDGGLHNNPDAARAHAQRMIAQGADLIDIGAESTRPGATPVSLEEEWSRLAPVLEVLADIGCLLSVDTSKSEIAARALAAGAHVINDVWGLVHDPAIADVVARHGAALVIMHNSRAQCTDEEIVSQIDRHFERSMYLATRAGIAESHIILDPGLGFAKTLRQNYICLNALPHFGHHGCPLLVGASRKSMIGKIIPRAPRERDAASLAIHTVAMERGAALIRCHEIRNHLEAAILIGYMRNVQSQPGSQNSASH